MIYSFKNGGKITVDFEKAAITSAFYKENEFVSGTVSLFAIKLRRRDGSSRICDAEKFRFTGFDGKIATYENDEICVGLIVEEKNGGLAFRLNAENKTDELLEWAELPSFCVYGKLKGEEGGRGEIVFPFNEGGLVTDMRLRESMPLCYKEPDYPSESLFDIFPNVICSQFIAYGLNGAGIFSGLFDEERTTKHIDFRYHGENIKIQTRVFCNVDYGESYTMPFDCVLSFYDGDWHDACEIYRKWFTAHLPEGLKKIEDNESLPKWYEESPLVAIYPVRGTRDTGDMSPNGFYPYEKALPFLSDLAEKTDSKVMALLMHWEGTAPWCPPYSYPPYGGEEAFKKFVSAAHARDMLVGLYCSGLGYTLKSNTIKEYDRVANFERDGVAEAVCVNSDENFSSKICKEQRDGVDLCPACEKTCSIIKEETEKICKSGVDYVQILDQNHGGNSYFCYSSRHGHVPAPGKWQEESVNRLIDGIDRHGAVFGCESAAAEPFISRLAFSDNRFELNYYIGTPIPVYSYLYHEYVNNFMGNQICSMIEKNETNFTMRLAYGFAAGDALSAVFLGDGEMLFSWCDWISPRERNVDKTVAYPFMKTLNGWRKRGGKNYLHFGRAVKPLTFVCGENKYKLEDGRSYLKVPEVTSSAYEYRGKTVQFLINYNLHKVTAELSREVTFYFDDKLKTAKRGRTIEIPALSVVMAEIS